jgi:hypothetical protein
MELLLNLIWLLLALGAYAALRRSIAHSGKSGLAFFQCWLALGCVLVVLFPVISATDDVHAMRAEIEESPVSKRSVRQGTSEKASVWNNRLQTPPAELPAFFLHQPGLEKLNAWVPKTFSLPSIAHPFSPGRAPPVRKSV